MQVPKYILLFAGVFIYFTNLTAQDSVNDSIRAASFISLAKELQDTKPDSALVILSNAKTFCLQHNLYNQLAGYINNTASVYVLQNNLTKAISEYEEAIQLCNKKNLARQQGLTYMYLGNLYQYMGNYSKAAENYLPSAELLKSNEERKKVLGLYRNILSVINNLHQQNLSLKHILPIITSDKTDETEMVQLLSQNNTGNIIYDFPDQAVVQEIDKGMAYVIFRGAKFPITSLKILEKYTITYRNIQKIPAGSLSRIPDIPMDGTLFIDDNKDKVFLIKDGMRHWIQTPEVLEQFGGHDAVCVSPPGTLNQVPDGADTVTLENIHTKFNFKIDYQLLTDSLKTVLQKNKDLTIAVGNGLKERNNSLQRQRSWLWVSLVGLAGVLGGLFLLSKYYRQKQKLHDQSLSALKAEEKLNQYVAVEKERTRIATDMHDDLGAGLSTLSFLAEKVKRNSFSDITKTDISKMQLTSTELMEKMNEIIWAMNEKNDTLEDLLFYCRNYAVSYFEENGLACNVELPEFIDRIPVSSEMRRNVFLIIKESLHNIVKHAGAKNVSIFVTTGKELEVVIKDDGKGKFDTQKITSGNGLLNIQKRIELMKSSFRYFNDNGFTIVFSVPLA